jgi:hypothetical protein
VGFRMAVAHPERDRGSHHSGRHGVQ